MPPPPKLDPKIDKAASEILDKLPAARKADINSMKTIDWDDCISIGFPGFKRWMNFYDRNVNAVESKVAAYEVEVRWHQKEISDYLDGYKATFTGRALLSEIRRACSAQNPNKPKRMTVFPYMRFATPDDLNADVRLSDADAAMPNDHWEDPIWQLKQAFNPFEKLFSANKGVGTNAIVEFTPDDWTEKVQRKFGIGSDPEAVLFHELVHAAGEMNGALARRKIIGRGGKQDGFDDEAEFMAIVITNIYMSETGDAQLRSSHKMPGAPLKDPELFLDKYSYLQPTPRDMIDRFSQLQLMFYTVLSQIPLNVSSFNPLSKFASERLAAQSKPKVFQYRF